MDKRYLRERKELECYLKSFLISLLLEFHSHICRKSWQEQYFKVVSSVINPYSGLTTVACHLCFPVLLWPIPGSFSPSWISSDLINMFEETFLTCEICSWKEIVLHSAWQRKSFFQWHFVTQALWRCSATFLTNSLAIFRELKGLDCSWNNCLTGLWK